MASLQKALSLRQDFPEAQNDLAWVLATSPQPSLRNGRRALELAQQADQSAGGRNPLFLRTLAAACAETGQFSDAIQNNLKANELARSTGQTNLSEHLNAELKLYQSGQPLRQ